MIPFSSSKVISKTNILIKNTSCQYYGLRKVLLKTFPQPYQQT